MRALTDYISRLENALKSEDGPSGTVRMDIDDLGSIYIDGSSVSEKKESADCILKTSHEDYEKIFSGKLDPAMAFSMGKLQINGNMALALTLPPLMARANA